MSQVTHEFEGGGRGDASYLINEYNHFVMFRFCCGVFDESTDERHQQCSVGEWDLEPSGNIAKLNA
jgi:hypothetical protein